MRPSSFRHLAGNWEDWEILCWFKWNPQSTNNSKKYNAWFQKIPPPQKDIFFFFGGGGG